MISSISTKYDRYETSFQSISFAYTFNDALASLKDGRIVMYAPDGFGREIIGCAIRLILK